MERRVEQSNIRVQALCPGFTYSEFHDVLRMERSAVPKSFWMTADFVVAESLRAFDRGQLIVIPGWRYKVLSAFMRATPPPLMRRIAAAAARLIAGEMEWLGLKPGDIVRLQAGSVIKIWYACTNSSCTPGSEKANWLSGGKNIHFNRIEWNIVPDGATAAAGRQCRSCKHHGRRPADAP